MECSVVDGPVAKERHGHMAGSHELRAVTASASLQHARPHDAACPHHSDLGREQVH